MSLKKLLKKCIPGRILYACRLFRISKNQNKNMKDVELEISARYRREIGRELCWDNPTSYTEKLNFSKLYNATKEKTILSDKYAVRKWVSEKIGEEYLIPVLGVYDTFEQIDFEQLPNSFVIKCNHDSGSTTIIRDKAKMNIKALKNRYDFFLKRNFAFDSYEMHYRDIKPLIIIEKLMANNASEELNDYKILCFDGKPYYCWVDYGRFTNHKRNVYDLNWNLQPFKCYYDNCDELILHKPEQYNQMIELAKKLSQGFDHVRVDFYIIKGKIYFGEMTFTNGSGFEQITPEEWDFKLGSLWNLNKDNRK